MPVVAHGRCTNATLATLIAQARYLARQGQVWGFSEAWGVHGVCCIWVCRLGIWRSERGRVGLSQAWGVVSGLGRPQRVMCLGVRSGYLAQ